MAVNVATDDDEESPLLSSHHHIRSVKVTYAPLPAVTVNPDVLEDALSRTDSHHRQYDGPQELSTWRKMLLLPSLGMLLFIQASNVTIISTTQGVIAATLDAYESASWFTSAFLVAMASVAPLSGRLSDIFQPRYCMFASSLIVALGSAVTGLAPDLRTFLLGRAITGIGAAGIFTVSLVLVVQLTTEKRRGLATGVLNSLFTIGVALGAVVAGALQPLLGWRPLFWGQAPLAVLAGFGLLCAIPSNLRGNGHHPSRYHNQPLSKKLSRLDYPGAFLLVVTLVFLLYGLSTPTISIRPIILALLIFPAFLYHEIYSAADPIIPLSVLSSRGALLTCLATVGFMISRWNILFYTPMYATAVRGWSPASAGSLLVPTNIGFAIGGLVPGFFHIRRAGSFWGSCVLVFAVFPASLAALAAASTDSSPTWVYVLFIFVNGALAGASMNYTLAHVMHLVLPEVRFVATSLVLTFRGFAGTFGSAIGGGIFARSLRSSLEGGFAEHNITVGPRERELMRTLIGSPRVVQELVGAEHKIAVQSYAYAIRTLIYSGVALAVVAFSLQAGTGSQAPEATLEAERRESLEDQGEEDALERGDAR